MAKSDQEIEVKFYITDLQRLEQRLQTLGAELIQPRTHEQNLRFDSPDGELGRTRQVLRLRQDRVASVTFKDAGNFEGGVRSRLEIEFQVNNFEAARKLFEALGYKVFLMYEKYRAVYRTGSVLVTLDELPYGNFAEIEGPDSQHIKQTSQSLDLEWESRILDSYTVLFDLLRITLHLEFRDLSFENFKVLEVPATALGVRPADVSRKQ
jgi:adenylate cyclase class 2